MVLLRRKRVGNMEHPSGQKMQPVGINKRTPDSELITLAAEARKQKDYETEIELRRTLLARSPTHNVRSRHFLLAALATTGRFLGAFEEMQVLLDTGTVADIESTPRPIDSLHRAGKALFAEISRHICEAGHGGALAQAGSLSDDLLFRLSYVKNSDPRAAGPFLVHRVEYSRRNAKQFKFKRDFASTLDFCGFHDQAAWVFWYAALLGRFIDGEKAARSVDVIAAKMSHDASRELEGTRYAEVFEEFSIVNFSPEQLSGLEPDRLSTMVERLMSLQEYEQAQCVNNYLLEQQPSHHIGISNQVDIFSELNQVDEGLCSGLQAISILKDSAGTDPTVIFAARRAHQLVRELGMRQLGYQAESMLIAMVCRPHNWPGELLDMAMDCLCTPQSIERRKKIANKFRQLGMSDYEKIMRDSMTGLLNISLRAFPDDNQAITNDIHHNDRELALLKERSSSK